MANKGSVPIILGLSGVAAVLLISGITGEGVSNIFKGDFGKVPTGSGQTNTGQSGDITGIATSSLVTPGANSPAAITNMVQWCNSVAGLYPYAWGGGHGSIGVPSQGTTSSSGGPLVTGFDCSGAVSGALGAAGFLSAPLVSGDLANWGSPGVGKYVTIWANADHTFMRILGHWFGTGKLGKGGGVDWGNYDPDLAAYSVRHPTGY